MLKIFTKLILFCFISLVSLSSCISNEDQEPDDIDPSIGLSKENLLGVWELYGFDKQIKTTNMAPEFAINHELRDPHSDGFSVEFRKDDKYFEYNAFGDKVMEAVYQLKNQTGKRDSVYFNISYYKGRYIDSASASAIPFIKPERFTSSTSYHGKAQQFYFNVRDTRRYKNVKQGVNYHPDVEKLDISKDRLLGKWRIDIDQTFINDQLQKVTKEKAVGTVFEFYSDLSMQEYQPDGSPGVKGSYRIFDDVIHIAQRAEKVESFLLWVTDWKTVGGRETVTISDEYRQPNEISKVIKRHTVMSRQASL